MISVIVPVYNVEVYIVLCIVICQKNLDESMQRYFLHRYYVENVIFAIVLSCYAKY